MPITIDDCIGALDNLGIADPVIAMQAKVAALTHEEHATAIDAFDAQKRVDALETENAALKAKVAALETENAALRKAAEPRPMSEAPRDGTPFYGVVEITNDDCKASEGARCDLVGISWVVGWFPRSPGTNANKSGTLTLSDLSDGTARQSAKVDFAGPTTNYTYFVNNVPAELRDGRLYFEPGHAVQYQQLEEVRPSMLPPVQVDKDSLEAGMYADADKKSGE